MKPVWPVTRTRRPDQNAGSGSARVMAVTLCDDPAIATVRILGAGGWIPTGTHATCSALLREGDAAVLIDAGSGVERLVADPSLLDGVERLELVLTHFHLDHVVGLAYLPGLRGAGGIPPRIWGPAQALFGDVDRRRAAHDLRAAVLRRRLRADRVARCGSWGRSRRSGRSRCARGSSAATARRRSRCASTTA